MSHTYLVIVNLESFDLGEQMHRFITDIAPAFDSVAAAAA
jgi:hypothetical protein